MKLMLNKEPIILLSVSNFSKIIHHYIMNDANCPYTVVAFVQTDTSKERINRFCDRPVVMYDEMMKEYPPTQYKALVAIGYVKMNTVRKRYISEVENLGYNLVNYVSSNNIVDPSVSFESNIIILESNSLQCFSCIRKGVILGRGNLIGHDSVVSECSFITNGVVFGGRNTIGQECFVGINATILDGVSIADRTLIGAASVITKNTKEGQVFITKGTLPAPDRFSASTFFDW